MTKSSAPSPAESPEELVPDAVIPHLHLPPLRYRDMPEPVSWKKMLGPSIVLAGLSLGSGEYVLWPYITYKTGFVFFWACLLGVTTQFFLNMEIERWTLVTGETAITGFCRLSRQWAWVFLLMTIIPYAWPGWATGAGTMLSWLLWPPMEQLNAQGELVLQAHYGTAFAIAGLIIVGVVLTAGPVVYNTVEKIQTVLVGLILVLVIVIGCIVIRPQAVTAMMRGAVNLGGLPDMSTPGIDLMFLLGALAFAGAGGALNLGQSNYIRDKGYGMGKYVGRITSPVTGQEEPIADIGYHFPHTPENTRRWNAWWRAANVEHFFSFFLTCIVCLCLLTLIAYSLFYSEDGTLKEDMNRYGKGLGFIWGQAQLLEQYVFGSLLKTVFLILGVALLLTTELGILDGVARIATDIVKVNYLRENPFWTQSKLYYLFLWSEILLGTLILMQPNLHEPLFLLKISAAMNGGVMFIYSLILLYVNNKILSRSLSMSPLRFVALVWSCAFFGYFTFQALRYGILPLVQRSIG